MRRTPANASTARQTRPAGVALERSTGTAACLLGKTWGYDTDGVWVSDGCGGEFVLGQAGTALAAPASFWPRLS